MNSLHTVQPADVSPELIMEKESLEALLSSKSLALAQLQQELDNANEEISHLKEELREERERLATFEAVEITNVSIISGLEMELSQAGRMNEWLTNELEGARSEILGVRREKVFNCVFEHLWRFSVIA